MTYHTLNHNDPYEDFMCAFCGRTVLPPEYGGRHRNHCPHCLSSLHVDIKPGDRKSDCRGIMKAIGIHVQKNGEWSIIHKCTACGAIKSNRIACDDNELLLVTIAAEPMMSLPFPAKKIISTLQKLSVEKERDTVS